MSYPIPHQPSCFRILREFLVLFFKSFPKLNHNEHLSQKQSFKNGNSTKRKKNHWSTKWKRSAEKSIGSQQTNRQLSLKLFCVLQVFQGLQISNIGTDKQIVKKDWQSILLNSFQEKLNLVVRNLGILHTHSVEISGFFCYSYFTWNQM